METGLWGDDVENVTEKVINLRIKRNSLQIRIHRLTRSVFENAVPSNKTILDIVACTELIRI